MIWIPVVGIIVLMAVLICCFRRHSRRPETPQMRTHSCGWSNVAQANYCRHCGARLTMDLFD